MTHVPHESAADYPRDLALRSGTKNTSFAPDAALPSNGGDKVGSDGLHALVIHPFKNIISIIAFSSHHAREIFYL